MSQRLLGLFVLLFFGLTTAASAAEALLRNSWEEATPAPGQVVRQGHGLGTEPALHLALADGQPHQITLWEMPNPPLTEQRWYLRGQVSYRAVAEPGYLELRSYFGPQQWYFTRTLANAGPLQALAGSSGWREVLLPFDASQANAAPQKLVLNLVLPKGGEVMLGEFALYQDELKTTAEGGWWSERQAGLIGGVGGTILGVLGGAIGVLAGIGCARTLTLLLVKGVILLSLPLVGVGLYALALGQPWSVYYPLLLMGGVTALVFGLNYRAIHQRYLQRELRQLRAQDRQL